MFPAGPFLCTLLDRVKAVVRRVARPVAELPRHSRAAAARAPEPISPVLRGVVRGWMSAKLRAISALMRRIEAGERLETPVRASPGRAGLAPRAHADAPAARDRVPPEERLPRGFGWMCAFGPNVRRDGQAFAAWLDEPATRAKVLAAPQRMARLIGPILTATGARRPEWFAAMPKRGSNVPLPCGGAPGRGTDRTENRGKADPEGGALGPLVPDVQSRDATPPPARLTRGGKFHAPRLGSREVGVIVSDVRGVPAASYSSGRKGDMPQSSRPARTGFSKMRPLTPRHTRDHFVTITKHNVRPKGELAIARPPPKSDASS